MVQSQKRVKDNDSLWFSHRNLETWKPGKRFPGFQVSQVSRFPSFPRNLGKPRKPGNLGTWEPGNLENLETWKIMWPRHRAPARPGAGEHRPWGRSNILIGAAQASPVRGFFASRSARRSSNSRRLLILTSPMSGN